MDRNDFKEQREALVRQLREKGIHDEKILEAIAKVPRHLFLDGTKHQASEFYEDVPLTIGEGQTISQPYTVAYQTQLLNVSPGDKILEIGTGSGYQSAVLKELGANVYSIERQEKLYEITRERMRHLGYDINMILGDGNNGIPPHAPYDKVIITAASPGIPEQLIKQMKTGGVMVVPVNGHVQRMKRITKISDTELKSEDFGHFRFVPMLSGIVMS